MKRSIAALIAVCLIVVAGPSDAQSSARHSYTIPHVLRFASAEDVVGLNPMLNQQATLNYLSEMTMAYLVRYDEHNEPIPELATVIPTQKNGGISADGKTITFHLRKDAVWSDGVKFSAADVKFSFAAVLNPKNNTSGVDGFDKITRVDTPDPATVVIHLKEPYGSFLGTFFSTGGANPALLPEHILGSLPNINNAPYNELPIGIGPFKYVSWKRGDSIQLVANPTYFGRKPKLERVIYKIIPDRNTVVTQLTTHELDLWIPTTAAFFDRVKSLPGISTLKLASFYYDHLDFNASHGALKDPVVRRALRLATDRALLLEKVRHGIGILQEARLSPAHPFYVDLPRIPFDIAKANALLDAAGYVRGADGIRAKNGNRLSFDFASSVGTPDTDTQIELIRSWWKQIGVEFEVHHYLSSIFFAPAQTGGTLYSGHFDIAAFAWGVGADGDPKNVFACNAIPPNGQNVERYCDPATDKLMVAFGRSYSDPERKKLMAQIERRIADAAPTMVLSVRQDLFSYNSDLTGFKPNLVSPFDDAANIDI